MTYYVYMNLSGCDADEFLCADKRTCIHEQFVCNRQDDCNDFSDEHDCSMSTRWYISK